MQGPPPNVAHNTEWKVSPYWRDVVTALHLTFAVISTIVYGLRLYAVHLKGLRYKLDDYLMGAGLVLSYGNTASSIVGAYSGMGLPIFQLPPAEIRRLQFTVWMSMKFWPFASALVKVSIIFFIKSLFGTQRATRRAFDALSIFTILWAFAAFFANTFQCSPPSYFYDKRGKGSCTINQYAFFISAGAINFACDVLILISPMPIIWKLKVTLRQKMALTFILAIGSLGCIFSLLRLIEFKNFAVDDIASSAVLEGTFTVLEVNMGIIGGCLPKTKPIFKGLLGVRSTVRSGKKYGKYGPDGSSGPDNSGSGQRYNSTHSRRPFQPLPGVEANATSWVNGHWRPSPHDERSSSEIELKGIEVHTAIEQEIGPPRPTYAGHAI